jgi:hypothetical protein
VRSTSCGSVSLTFVALLLHVWEQKRLFVGAVIGRSRKVVDLRLLSKGVIRCCHKWQHQKRIKAYFAAPMCDIIPHV